MIGFIGKSESNFDIERRRLVIPSKFRNLFEDSCIVTLGFDCLIIYKPDEWEKMTTRIGGSIQGDGEIRRELMVRDLYSNAELLLIDRQNRVVIPQGLVERLGLQREVVIIGVWDHLEVWNKGTWLEFDMKMRAYRERAYREELEKLGINIGA